MSVSTWLSNNRVQPSIVDYKGYKFLIYTSVVGSHSVEMIEELKSRVRLIPNEQPTIEGGHDLERFVKELMDQLIAQNF